MVLANSSALRPSCRGRVLIAPREFVCYQGELVQTSWGVFVFAILHEFKQFRQMLPEFVEFTSGT